MLWQYSAVDPFQELPLVQELDCKFINVEPPPCPTDDTSMHKRTGVVRIRYMYYLYIHNIGSSRFSIKLSGYRPLELRPRSRTPQDFRALRPEREG